MSQHERVWLCSLRGRLSCAFCVVGSLFALRKLARVAGQRGLRFGIGSKRPVWWLPFVSEQLPPPVPPKALGVAVRSAEKNRVSTCSFADEIAAAAITAYHRHRPQEWRHQQTVLAAFVACRSPPGPRPLDDVSLASTKACHRRS